jgi:hypothetical protein
MDNKSQIEKDSDFVADFCKEIKSVNGFDSVVIIATKIDSEKGTLLFSASTGNFYSCLGSAEEWIARQQDMMEAL